MKRALFLSALIAGTVLALNGIAVAQFATLTGDARVTADLNTLGVIQNTAANIHTGGGGTFQNFSATGDPATTVQWPFAGLLTR